MDAPICRFVERYAAAEPLRLHMPGHKGSGPLGFEARDITEVAGADVLYQPRGIIRQSEANAEALWGSRRTVYSAEGSSLSIRAMLYLLRLHCGPETRILAGRNAHKVFVTAAALLDLQVRWLYPRGGNLLCCPVTPADAEEAILAHRPHALYLTSPDYLGNVADIRGISQVCHKYGVLLLVDNAHGAYLRFLPESRHPLDLGADLCCDSAHKTLPVLTGGGYLHVSKAAPADFAANADRAMALFASTSPSYLILQSLDAANVYLAGDYRTRLARAADLWARVRAALEEKGWETAGNEPMKLTLLPKSFGYSGSSVAEYLENRGIVPEFSDPDAVVLMVSPSWEEAQAQRLLNALLALPRREAVLSCPPALGRPEAVMAPAAAIFAPCETVPAGESLGRIAATPTVSCPPAIPVVACGERIDADALAAMVYYGTEEVSVILEDK